MEYGGTGKWFCLLLMVGQSLGGVDAASENCPKQQRINGRNARRKKMKESSWVQMDQRISGQEEKKCRRGMQKESKWQGVLF